jgi:hypothetical protein
MRGSISNILVARYHVRLSIFENADAEQKERLLQTWQLYSQLGKEASARAGDFAMLEGWFVCWATLWAE